MVRRWDKVEFWVGDDVSSVSVFKAEDTATGFHHVNHGNVEIGGIKSVSDANLGTVMEVTGVDGHDGCYCGRQRGGVEIGWEDASGTTMNLNLK